MFAATGRWFRRNRTPIAVGVGVVGAGYVATQYVWGKITHARQRMSSERIAKENLRRRFEQNQEDCTYTVAALLPTAATHILEAMDTEKITFEIQAIKGSGTVGTSGGISASGDSISIPESTTTVPTATATDDGISVQSESGVHASQMSLAPPTPRDQSHQQKPARTKRQLWGDLTISSITRAYTLLYTLGLLTMLTRIQLNLLGRRSYLSSVVSLATGTPEATISLENNDDDKSLGAYGDDFEVNRKYLTFSWWLLNTGWASIMQRVELAVKEVYGPLSPREQTSLATFEQLTARTRKLIEHDGSGPSWLDVLLPPRDQEEYVLRVSGILNDNAGSQTLSPGSSAPLSSPAATASLRRLLDETADLIESPTFGNVLAQILDAGFRTLLQDKLQQAVFTEQSTSLEPSSPPAGSGVAQQVLLPKILSVLTRQAHVIANGMPNEYLMSMEQVPDLEGFAAVVYSSNWENEIVREDELAQHSGAAPESFVTAVSSPVQQSRGAVMAEESIVVVDEPTQSSFENAWEKASARS